jgi:hypothetical protein
MRKHRTNTQQTRLVKLATKEVRRPNCCAVNASYSLRVSTGRNRPRSSGVAHIAVPLVDADRHQAICALSSISRVGRHERSAAGSASDTRATGRAALRRSRSSPRPAECPRPPHDGAAGRDRRRKTSSRLSLIRDLPLLLHGVSCEPSRLQGDWAAASRCH